MARSPHSSKDATGVEAFVQHYRALPSGHYRELEPAADLRAYVACGWIKSVRLAPGDAADGSIPVIPDGCADIITYDADPPFVVGPDDSTRWVPMHDGLVITGLRLRPGALRSVLGCSAWELLGRSALLSDLSRDGAALHRALQAARELSDRLALLEGWVRARLLRAAVRDVAVLRACRMIALRPQVRMDSVADALGWNARMLHREFSAACGYGPKYLQRILRVQGVLRAAHTLPEPRRLSDVAIELGFADHAHLTRDFRSITGFTPSEYLPLADAELGRWLEHVGAEPA
jgi:AraC-like DNA-binding protein